MMKDQHRWLQFALVLWNCMTAVISLLLAGIFRFQSIRVFFAAVNGNELVILMLFACITAFFISDLYNRFLERPYREEFFSVLRFVCVLLIIVLLYTFGTKNRMVLSRLTLLYFILADTALLFVSHCLIKKVCRLYASGRNGWKLLIVTDIENAERACKSAASGKNSPLGVLLLDRPSAAIPLPRGLKLLCPDTDCLRYVTQNAVDEVLLVISEERYCQKDFRELLVSLSCTGAVVSVRMKPFYAEKLGTYQIRQEGEDYVLSFAEREYDYLQRCVKQAADIIISIPGLILTAVIGLLIAPAVLIESPGGLLFRQRRVGRNGRVFTIYKFRSMRSGAESEKAALENRNKMKGPLFKIDGDPRITRVGRFLRKTSIDEMPQFLNVLLGDMSLVGPRPPTLEEYGRYTGFYKKRLHLKPGMTGIWQTSGRSEIRDFDDILNMDLQYIREWSLMLDIKLLLKTVKVVLSGKGAE